jgi:O-acetyl-ADP-ribose deacetylase
MCAELRSDVADRLSVFRGDITTLHVDAIVNAANERMLGGGGVDGAIHRAAGPRLVDACRAVPEVRAGVRCPTGEARITPGFALPAKYVIHTVGPVWHGGGAGEDALLTSCYRTSLELAARQGITSIAFPAISCGVFMFPPERAATIAVREIRQHLGRESSVSRVVLVAFDAGLFEILTRATDYGAPASTD